MSQKSLKPDLVKKIWILLALILLVGISVLGYGYYENSRLAFYMGLAITLIGVISGLIRIVIYPIG
jgi:hypothetical protein